MKKLLFTLFLFPSLLKAGSGTISTPVTVSIVSHSTATLQAGTTISVPLGRIDTLYSSNIISTGTFNVANVVSYGARGDCTTDDTSAIQSAINTGRDVYFPGTSSCYKLTSPITVSTANQTIFGDGNRSYIKQTNGATATTGVFQVSNTYGVTFTNLAVTPSSASISTLAGYGFEISGSSNVTVQNCLIKNHQRGGVLLYNSTGCVVTNNILKDAYQTGNYNAFAINQYGVDIYVAGRGTLHKITNNTILNSCGTGIGIQTLNSSDTITGILIDNNIISTAPIYGIFLYKFNFPQDVLQKNIVSNNLIQNVLGNIIDTGVFYYGTGVYIQGAEYTTVVGNNIFNTNFTTNTISNTLAPGGIGVTNTKAIDIVGNTIEKTNGWAGILIRDPNNFGDTTGYALVSGNHIKDAAQGILGEDLGQLQITANTVDKVTGYGIQFQNFQNSNTVWWPNINITENSIRNSGGGISVDASSFTSIIGNNISSAAAYGITLSSTTECLIASNMLIHGAPSALGTGLLIGNKISSCSVVNNYITRNGFGVIVNSTASFANNKIYGNTTDFTANIPITDYGVPFQNDAAPLSYVGVSITTSTTNNTTAGATTLFSNIISTSVGIGTWDISAMGVSNMNASTATVTVQYAISTNSGSTVTDQVPGLNQTETTTTTFFGASDRFTVTIPPYRLSFTVPTTVYFKHAFTYTGSAGTPATRFASLKATRVR